MRHSRRLAVLGVRYFADSSQSLATYSRGNVSGSVSCSPVVVSTSGSPGSACSAVLVAVRRQTPVMLVPAPGLPAAEAAEVIEIRASIPSARGEAAEAKSVTGKWSGLDRHAVLRAGMARVRARGGHLYWLKPAEAAVVLDVTPKRVHPAPAEGASCLVFAIRRCDGCSGGLSSRSLRTPGGHGGLRAPTSCLTA